MSSRPLLVIGGIALDITATVGSSLNSILHTSTPGRVKQSLGGVGRNVAEAAWRTGASRVKLLSVVGNDLAGITVRQGMASIGMTTDHIQTLENQPTAVYNALHSHDGQLVAAVADMNIFDHMDPEHVTSVIKAENPNFVCFDGNLSAKVMKAITNTCSQYAIPALFEPTSVPKSLKLFDHVETITSGAIQYTSPNQFELEAMCDTIQSHPVLSLLTKMNRSNQHVLSKAPKLAESVLPHAIFMSHYIPNIVTKLGEEGCLFVSKERVQYYSPEVINAKDIKSVTGAGDCFVGTLIANLQKHNNNINMDDMIEKSQLSSIRTLKSDYAVSPYINNDLLT